MAESDSRAYGRVYLVTNTKNGKQYVGQTVYTVAQRWSKHCRTAGRDSNGAMALAILKYGAEAFAVEELATADSVDELNALEAKFVDELRTLYPNGYNIREGGGSRGRMADTERRRMSARMKKKWEDPEYVLKMRAIHDQASTRERMSEASRVRWADAEYRRKIEAISSTDAFKQKLSSASKENWRNPEHRAKMAKAQDAVKEQRVARLRLRWQDFDFRRSQRELVDGEEWRAKHREGVMRAVSKPEFIANMSGAAKKRWDDPEKRKALLDAMHSPEAKAKWRASMAEVTKDPEWQAKKSAALKEAWIRRKQKLAERGAP